MPWLQLLADSIGSSLPSRFQPSQLRLLILALACQSRFVGTLFALSIAQLLRQPHLFAVTVNGRLCLVSHLPEPFLQFNKLTVVLQQSHTAVYVAYLLLLAFEVTVGLQVVEHRRHEPRPVLASAYLSAICSQKA